ncbi:MAG TPA: hypothetical protein DD422_09580 [Akkermansia sp.]|nr:hypothetical protein [Akkermansia sp.]
MLTGGQSGRLPPPGEKSVAFNINSTQELKAFLEKLPLFFPGFAVLQWTAVKNERIKTFRPFLPMLKIRLMRIYGKSASISHS